MTLINYLTRVHFADGILEQALWAEMNGAGRTRPLIVTDPGPLSSEAVERLSAGLPIRTDAIFFRDCPKTPTERDARRLGRLYEETRRDCVIAFGGRAAIEFAKLARLMVGHEGGVEEIARSARQRSTGQRSTRQRPAAPPDRPDPPDLIVAPRISGLGATVNAFVSLRDEGGARKVVATRRLIPTVAICDPTLGLGADAAASAAAGAGAILACVEPYLAGGYNPPADGIALDGLRRALASLPRVLRRETLEDRREMAAASLNGSLAQEKGPCVAYALVDALCSASAAAPDSGAVGRLVLPGVLRIGGGRARDARRLTVRDMLRLTAKDCLAEGVEAFLKPLPLPASLSAMGVTGAEAARAAEEAHREIALMRGAPPVRADEIHAVLEAVL